MAGRARAAVGLLSLILVTLLTPALVPAVNWWHAAEPFPPTYLPALEGPRFRLAFEESRVSDLQRLNPGYVVIGDSMAGTRIDERRLGQGRGCSQDKDQGAQNMSRDFLHGDPRAAVVTSGTQSICGGLKLHTISCYCPRNLQSQ